jgi:hypothetical protein
MTIHSFRKWIFVFFFIFMFGWFSPLMASRFGGNQSSGMSNKEPKKPFQWPGRYECQQCTGAQSNGSNSCWNYEITIINYEDSRRGQILVTGSDGELGLKNLVTGDGDNIEFHFTEPMDLKAKVPLAKNDVAIALQHRDDDVILHFRKLLTKVSGQTAITCQKSK